jgi:DNA-binding NarL/FixJ family response regulator
MNIVIVEDNRVELDEILPRLCGEFPGVNFNVIETESAFRRAVPDLRATPPTIVIMDMLLRWSDAGSEEEQPAEIGGDFYSAGLRCQTLLASYPETKNVPIIFYSMLDRNDAIPDRLPRNTVFSTKSRELFDLVRKIRNLIAAQNKIVTPPLKDQVFVSYSHKDKKFLDELLVHLKPLERAGRVTVWSDQQINPGARWFGEIKIALASSKVVVMLLTSNFLASDFIQEHELGPVLKEAEAGGVTILWILVRACSYHETALRNFQAVMPLDKPLAQMKAERDSAWVQICKEIKKAIE